MYLSYRHTDNNKIDDITRVQYNNEYREANKIIK